MAKYRAWGKALPIAFEGTGFGIPVTIGATGLLFSRISPSMVVPGVVAALCGLVLMHLAAAANGRPMVYTTRVLEAVTLVGFLEHFILKMPGWGLEDTAEHRLMLVMMTCIGAALLLPLCYMLRLQRFARMIPAPVFAGFNTAVAVALVVSQARVLLNSVSTDGAWVSVVALCATVVALFARRWVAFFPPGVTSLVVASVAASVLMSTGIHTFATVLPSSAALALPLMIAPWSDLAAPQVALLDVAKDLFVASATIAMLVFLNTMVAEEAISQSSGGQRWRRGDWVRTCSAQMMAVLLGSPPVAASVTASRAALQVGPLDRRSMYLIAILVLAIFASGVLTLVPMPGVAGLLLYEAWSSYDRPSTRLFFTWLRQPETLGETQKEDLITVFCVVASSIVFNMVAGVFVGVLAGFVLYAWRNGKRMVRVVSTGAQVHSNCTRLRGETKLLAQGAELIRYIEFEGALFFGSTEFMETLVLGQFGPGHYLVVDWSHVKSADSTVARAFVKCMEAAPAAGTNMVVSGLDALANEVPEIVQAAAAKGKLYPDADRALEWAENEVIAKERHTQPGDSTSMVDAQTWLQGVPVEARATLESALELRLIRTGETVFSAGDPASDLMIVIQGSVDIVLQIGSGREIRVARFRSGATMGELGFLDASPRSASAIAAEDVLLGVLTRSRFDELARHWPQAGQQVLVNLALDMAIRLRRTNTLAVNQSR